MLIGTGDLPPMQQPVEEIQAPRYYWRSMTYQTYTGSGWTNPPATIVQVPARTKLLSAQPENYRRVHEVVTFPASVQPGAYWAGVLVAADTQGFGGSSRE